MVRRRTQMDDPRELPAYTISEAAHYLTVPAATIRYWSMGRDGYAPLIAVPARTPTLPSFLNLVELHVLAAIRRKHDVKMPSIRRAIRYLAEHARRETDKRHPLISRELETDDLDLFTEQYGQLVNISHAGQTAMRKIISAALRRIERDLDGIPIKLYPFTRTAMDDAPALVGRKGRVAITKDRNIRYRAAELAAIRRHSARVIVIRMKHATGPDIAALLVKGRRRIARFAAKTPAPFVAGVYGNGQLNMYQGL